MEGLVFGLVDNGVLAVCALYGIDLDQKFSGKGVNGALYGALIGNSISDFMGGVFGITLIIIKVGMVAMKLILVKLAIEKVVMYLLQVLKMSLRRKHNGE